MHMVCNRIFFLIGLTKKAFYLSFTPSLPYSFAVYNQLGMYNYRSQKMESLIHIAKCRSLYSGK